MTRLREFARSVFPATTTVVVDTRLPSLAALAAMVAGPVAAAGVIARSLRGRERRDRVVALLTDFLAEPMATSRRSAWAFLHGEGDEARHFSHYVLHDPGYGADDSGFAALLKVVLFHRTVQDLRRTGALDERLYRELLEPHRQAWSTYTAQMAARSALDAEALERGDADLFRWRDGELPGRATR